MPLTINTNMAASQAAFYLSKNNDMLQQSLNRLSSGKRITKSSDDAGGLAVSMKLEGSIDRLKGASNNVSNAISFLQVQDGLLESAANIVSRMGELKGLYADVLKSTSDKATYDSEFKDLQVQIYQIAQTKFNGVRLFGDYDDTDTLRTASATFGTDNITMDISVSEDGSSTVAIDQSLILSALTIDVVTDGDGDGSADLDPAMYNDRVTNPATAAAGADKDWSFAALQSSEAFNLDKLDTAVFTKALENLATLRATNGGQVSRLQFAQENLTSQATNMQAAAGRIMDVDVAEETANLAKQQILVQASAAMVAQANSANNVALMLLQ